MFSTDFSREVEPDRPECAQTASVRARRGLGGQFPATYVLGVTFHEESHKTVLQTHRGRIPSVFETPLKHTLYVDGM